MKVPHFREIVLKQEDLQLETLQTKLQTNGASYSPIYVTTEKIDKELFFQILANLVQAINNLNIHPHFPYPIYLVTNYINSHQVFPVYDNKKKLPKHFVLKNYQLASKDSKFVKKISMLCNRINNHALSTRYQEINSAFYRQKELFNLTKEIDFCLKISEKLDMEERI